MGEFLWADLIGIGGFTIALVGVFVTWIFLTNE
jgi:hypothetical protein